MSYSPDEIQEFIRTLSLAEVRRYLNEDHLGAAFLATNPEAAESDTRWQLFDVFLCRGAFFRRSKEHKNAVDSQAAAQMELLTPEAR